MPTSLIHILPCHNAQYISITAQLYGTTSKNPIRIPIRTRTTKELRDPIVEEVFGSDNVRVQVHDAEVTLRRGRQLHRFCIFVTNRQALPLNAAVASLSPGRIWRGNILVMRLGSKVNGVVNLRTGDQRLIRRVLRHWKPVAGNTRRGEDSHRKRAGTTCIVRVSSRGKGYKKPHNKREAAAAAATKDEREAAAKATSGGGSSNKGYKGEREEAAAANASRNPSIQGRQWGQQKRRLRTKGGRYTTNARPPSQLEPSPSSFTDIPHPYLQLQPQLSNKQMRRQSTRNDSRFQGAGAGGGENGRAGGGVLFVAPAGCELLGSARPPGYGLSGWAPAAGAEDQGEGMGSMKAHGGCWHTRREALASVWKTGGICATTPREKERVQGIPQGSSRQLFKTMFSSLNDTESVEELTKDNAVLTGVCTSEGWRRRKAAWRGRKSVWQIVNRCELMAKSFGAGGGAQADEAWFSVHDGV
ncbi:hypothetical protein GALMADRAFT_209805 [Galerina marginata CBS 339.88]|uniref:Uncharacterized protein n=1 Tax=Galerina marginata (strain CBS 339.88) TaxID=685588 RepID=A0A067T2S8_GALM3|nr:hypothetical protein GALMADRAFT_209805 [Galerina marginata CBS 339.88]